jgi:hypothetical protein
MLLLLIRGLASDVVVVVVVVVVVACGTNCTSYDALLLVLLPYVIAAADQL